jgi:hypothetical protein
MPKIIYDLLEDGTKPPSVTTVISGNLGWNKQALMWWANQEGLEGRHHRDTAARAAEIGTIVHEMIECDIKGEEFEYEKYDHLYLQKARHAYAGYYVWKGIVDFKPLESEYSIVSERHRFAGTIDIAAISGQPCIIDLKTSNAVYADHIIQLAAYGILWADRHPETPFEAYYLLRLGKEDGSFHYHYWPREAMWEAENAFMNLLVLHNLHKKLRKMI